MMNSKPIKVLIVDDSRTMCALLSEILSSDPRIEVVGCARDSIDASEKLRKTQPDVMTLDVEMPITDGVTFLKKVMRTRPLPVLMLSCQTRESSPIAQDVIEAGAVDYMFKSTLPTDGDLKQYSSEVINRVCKAATIKVGPGEVLADTRKTTVDITPISRRIAQTPSLGGALNRVVAIGASTGGPEAMRNVLADFYVPNCALVISQHMPEKFMEAFAERLNRASKFDIAVAHDGQRIEAGKGYVAPGNQHLKVRRNGTDLVCETSDGILVNGHRPSVDVMFESLVATLGASTVAILLTGMGEDGAMGLKKLHDIGCATAVQDKFSSAVWGMPGRAYELGAADQIIELDEMGNALTLCLKTATRGLAA